MSQPKPRKHERRGPGPRGRRVDQSSSSGQASSSGRTSFSATEAKNEFGRVLETVLQGGRVVITKHDVPKAMILSVDDYDALSGDATRRLASLSEEFDAQLERMQAPRARAGMRSAFDASPAQLGKAATAAARKTRG